VGAAAWLLLSLHVCLAAFGGASSALDGLMVLPALLEAMVPPRALWLIWCQKVWKAGTWWCCRGSETPDVYASLAAYGGFACILLVISCA